jgi:hypothetical protein
MNNMYSVILQGGLCNQMFQIMAIYSHASKNNYKFVIDKRYIEKNGHSNKQYEIEIFSKIVQENNITYDFFYKENDEDFAQYRELPNIPKNILFKGYFQNYKYIEYALEHIDKIFDFTFTNISSRSNTYFIHVRKGDYKNNQLHSIDLTNYYKNAIEIIKNKEKENFKNILFLIFSDNIKECVNENLFYWLHNKCFVNEQDEIKTLKMMAKCYNGGIGCNSSFSLMAMYLNSNPNKTMILPNKWLNNHWQIDIYPPNCYICSV